MVEEALNASYATFKSVFMTSVWFNLADSGHRSYHITAIFIAISTTVPPPSEDSKLSQ